MGSGDAGDPDDWDKQVHTISMIFFMCKLNFTVMLMPDISVTL